MVCVCRVDDSTPFSRICRVDFFGDAELDLFSKAVFGEWTVCHLVGSMVHPFPPRSIREGVGVLSTELSVAKRKIVGKSCDVAVGLDGVRVRVVDEISGGDFGETHEETWR